MKLLFAGGTVIDGTGSPGRRADVLVEGDRIQAIGHPDDFGGAASDVARVDCQGKTVIPGLMDLHVHLMLDGEPDPLAGRSARRAPANETPGYLFAKMARNAARTLDAGFTLVREAGCKHYLSVDLRRAIADGVLRGPRVVAAQPIIMTGGHGHFLGAIEADGADEVRKAARQAIKNGIDVVKVMATGGVLTHGVEPGSPQMTVEEIRAAMDEAHAAGKRTMTHAQGVRGIRNAVEAGVDCVEHGQFMGFDDELMELVAQRGVAYVATLCNNPCKIEAEERARARGEAFTIPESAMRKARGLIEPHRQTFARAREMNLLLGAGTDAGSPLNFHGENAQELEVMVRYGMTPLQALAVATLRSAEIVGLERELGSLEPGKQADLVVVAGDPASDITVLRRPGAIEAVYVAGRLTGGTRHGAAEPA